MKPLSLLDVVHRPSPEPWHEGDCIPWNEPGFSARMLREHLTQAHDKASRRPEVVDAHVRWLHEHALQGRTGRVLDLACGPGLYLHRLARLGHRGVGVDFSPASVVHARQVAEAEGLDLRFVEADVRHAAFGEGYSLATLLFGQLNVFRRDEARALMRKAHDALGQGGLLIVEADGFDAVRGDGEPHSTWSTAEQGLFSDRPHLTLHERRWSASARCATERWYVVDADTGHVTRHAQTSVAYTDEELGSLLEEAGFGDVRLLPALPATPRADAMRVLSGRAGGA